MKIYISILILFCATSSIAQDSDLRKIDSIVNSKITENDPALFVGIVKDGKIIYQKTRGLISLQHQVKATEKSVSNIASTAKQFTALMILQLSIEEKLSLEDDIRKYLPTFYPKVKEAIKIRHLLNHTSGVRDFYDLMSIQQNPWWRREGLDNNDALELLEKQQDLAFKPGSRYLYSNSGYTILTKIIAVASGEDFHDYSKNFFENLGMKNTQFLKDYMYVIPNIALPYSDWGDGIWQQYPMITNLYGDGFLFTSLEDQLIFEKAVQNANHNNNRLLIESQKPIKNSEIQTYGFGLELEDRLNRKSVHHSGRTGSYHSQIVRYPDDKLSVFVMSNNSRLWSGAIADEITNVLLLTKELKNNYNKKIKETENLNITDAIVGQYRSPGAYLIRIESKEGKLFWRNGNNNPRELVQENKNIYKMKSNPSLKVGFFKNELNLFYESGKIAVYEKIPYEKPTLADLESYEGEYYSTELEMSFTIDLKPDNTLKISLEKWDEPVDLAVLNRNELLVYDYILKIKRDQFSRVVEILLTTNRVLNNKFVKKTKLKFQPKIETENGSINVTTIGSKNGNSSQILLTKNYTNGNEIWSQQFGGKSYDKANSIIATKDGYLIIGSTSSFGNGNYDMFVIKTDKKGKKIWQNTYGGFYNEYGYSAEKTDTGFLLKGTKQNCTSNSDIFNRKCTTNVWVVAIDKKGKEISNTVLEEIE
ncbi:serine hydrolase [Polaribacter sp. Hel_I_88]|uniref:serine hydrolase domain-containing protein n=1 Tax=Polaribacter sp. Hel_I_88 TaxID=1250006 RepID=UPI0004792E63|nr:serine hydrolase domain-containing protein [Polaribacter sp. Hel_I_88]